MNELTVFRNDVFGEIRTLQINSEPWFVGKDVAEVLGYSNTRDALRNHVDEDDKASVVIHDGSQNRKMVGINESGLYSLILSSKLQGAKDFKRWVTSEVLPQIRKTGGYVNNDEQFINTYLPFADDNTKLLFRTTLHTINEQNKIIQQQKETIVKKDAELDYKEDVIIGLTEDIDLAEKRQRITQIIRHNANGKYSERYGLLYKEYEMKYHVDINRRMDGAKDRGEIKKSMKKMEYICDVMNHTAELYEIACKVFENDVDELIKLWKETI